MSVLLCAGLALTLIHSRQAAHQREALLQRYVAALAAEPGVLVTHAAWGHDRVSVTGLRDPLAPQPNVILARYALPAANVSLAPYQSLDPPIVERRARRALRPPETATVQLRDGKLVVAGVAPRTWIQEARRIAPSLAGLDGYDDRELRAAETVVALDEAQDRLERRTLPFALDSSVLDSPREVAQAAEAAREVVEAARVADVELCINVVGHADVSGPYVTDLRLSEARARKSAHALVAKGLAPAHLLPVGAGVRFDAVTAAQARRTTFRPYLGMRCAEW
jgi:OOP family OmpA-OmpF porin